MFQASANMVEHRSSDSADKFNSIIAKGLVQVDAAFLSNIRIAPIKPITNLDSFPDCWVIETGKEISTRDAQLMDAVIVRHWDDYPNIEFYDLRSFGQSHLIIVVELLLLHAFVQQARKVDLVLLSEQVEVVKQVCLATFHRVSVVNQKGVTLVEEDKTPDDTSRRVAKGFRGSAFKDWALEEKRTPFTREAKQETDSSYSDQLSSDEKTRTGHRRMEGKFDDVADINRAKDKHHKTKETSVEKRKNNSDLNVKRRNTQQSLNHDSEFPDYALMTPADASEFDPDAGES